MTSKRIQRALSATEWANRPIRWAVRLSLGDAPFKTLRKLPLRALSRMVGLQISLLNKWRHNQEIGFAAPQSENPLKLEFQRVFWAVNMYGPG